MANSTTDAAQAASTGGTETVITAARRLHDDNNGDAHTVSYGAMTLAQIVSKGIGERAPRPTSASWR